MTVTLPAAPLGRVLRRADEAWSPLRAAHQLVYGMTGSGKTSLIKLLLGLCQHARVLILDPKQHPDPVWDGPPGDPWRWGRPVTSVGPLFGLDGTAGGPAGQWLRLCGTPDRRQTAARLGQALDIVAAEGHVVLVIDDAREVCRQLGLAAQVDSIMNLSRSSGVSVILAATEPGFVAGRHQTSITWVGATSGLDSARAGAAMLGHSGRAWHETTAAVRPHEWIYADSQPGNAGPVLTS